MLLGLELLSGESVGNWLLVLLLIKSLGGSILLGLEWLSGESVGDRLLGSGTLTNAVGFWETRC